MECARPVGALVAGDLSPAASRQIATDQSADRSPHSILKTKTSGHRGSDGSSAGDRLSRYGDWADSLGEDIVYHSRSAREDVISLIIDDGTSNRGHRKNMFKPDFHVIGIALSPLGPTPSSVPICVITFAGGYQDKPSTDPKAKTPTATRF